MASSKKFNSSSHPEWNPEYAVAGIPDATLYEGATIFVNNGAAGSPVLAFSDGTNWLRCDTLAAVAAS